VPAAYRLVSRFPQISAQAHVLARAAVTKAAHDIEAKAKLRVPVDTGATKNSIHTTATGDLSAEVAATTSYAHYLEYGTVKMAARPYMLPAARDVEPSFLAAMSQITGRGLR